MSLEISHPLPVLAIQVKSNASIPAAPVTRFLLVGDDFDIFHTATATITETTGSSAANRYRITVTAVTVVSEKLLEIHVTCLPPTNATAKHKAGKVAITVNSGGSVSYRDLPVMFCHHNDITIDYSRLTLQKLPLHAMRKTVLFYPITGLEEPGNTLGATFPPGGEPEYGTWSIIRARQLRGRVKITLQCTDVNPPLPSGGGGTRRVRPILPLSRLKITLTGAENSSVSTPPVDVVYGPDPEEEPE